MIPTRRNRGIHLVGHLRITYGRHCALSPPRRCLTVVSEKAAFATVLASGVIIPGLAKYFLSAAGYATLGSIVWMVGFGTMVFVIWYVWLRPMDITGPVGSE
jgi:hypothetical protein